MKIKIENEFICDSCYNSDISDEIDKYRRSTGHYTFDFIDALLDGTVKKILKKKCNHIGSKAKRDYTYNYINAICYGTIEIIDIYLRYGKFLGFKEGLSFEYYQDYLNNKMRKLAKEIEVDLSIEYQYRYKVGHLGSLKSKIDKLIDNNTVQ